jgi:hypothetical protein
MRLKYVVVTTVVLLALIFAWSFYSLPNGYCGVVSTVDKITNGTRV